VPRQFGKVDGSAGWPQLPCCPHRHPVSVACPPTGAWLVLALCHHCDPKTGRYCKAHRDRIADTEPLPAPTQDVQLLRIGGDA
jgi:hypothetical protein